MPEEPRVHTEDAELSLEDIAGSLPGTGEIMASVGQAWWKCAHAARGGNWALAAYFARRVRSLQRKLAVVRPKYKDDLAGFERDRLGPIFAALEKQDLAGFERAFGETTDEANRLHAKWGKSYIRWTLPAEPPRDLDLGPGGSSP